MNQLVLATLLLTTVMTLNHVSAGELTRSSNAVKVQRGGLVHTCQLLARDADATDFGAGDVLNQLKQICDAQTATLEDVARLNCYVSEDNPEMVTAVQSAINENWPKGKRPAVTIIPTTLPHGANVAVDAIFVVDSTETTVKRFGDDAVLMPAGRDMLFVAGRAADGELAEATAGTMKQLLDVLAHVGSRPSDVVRVKAFIKPMTEWTTVASEIEKSFGDLGTPPIVYVEWTSKSLPTEIELIAAAPDHAETDETVTYLTPPGDQASPVFSRMARVHSDEIIYIGGTVGTNADSPESEVRTLFDTLRETAKSAGTDLRHFAKAMYYVSDDSVSAALNKIRPELYDPQRPPAASKVQVPSVGVAGRGLLIDMVAVPAAP